MTWIRNCWCDVWMAWMAGPCANWDGGRAFCLSRGWLCWMRIIVIRGMTWQTFKYSTQDLMQYNLHSVTVLRIPRSDFMIPRGGYWFLFGDWNILFHSWWEWEGIVWCFRLNLALLLRHVFNENDGFWSVSNIVGAGELFLGLEIYGRMTGNNAKLASIKIILYQKYTDSEFRTLVFVI